MGMEMGEWVKMNLHVEGTDLTSLLLRHASSLILMGSK